MGDTHFAESLLTLLLEIWPAISTDLAVHSRLKSQQATIRLERKQFAEVETDLLECLRALHGTPYTKSLGAAYCMLALSKCFDGQQKTDKAQSAQRNAIVIAEKVLGADHPEVKCFR